MRGETVARAWAEALFELARRHEGPEEFGWALDVVTAILQEEPSFGAFLRTPSVGTREKHRVLREAFGGRVPVNFLNFLHLMVDRGRQGLLREVAAEYHALLDDHLGRIRVDVTVARPVDGDGIEELGGRLSRILGKRAVPRVRVDPGIVGGVVFRAGDRVYDGSVRRRLRSMRRQLLAVSISPDGDMTQSLNDEPGSP